MTQPQHEYEGREDLTPKEISELPLLAEAPEEKLSEWRTRAEELLEEVERTRSFFDYSDLPEEQKELLEGPPRDKEAEVLKWMAFFASQESWMNRSLTEVISDTAATLVAAEGYGQRDEFDHGLQAQARQMLKKLGQPSIDTGDLSPEIVETARKWAALEVFGYHYYRGWGEGEDDEFLDTLKCVGMTESDLKKLVLENLVPETPEWEETRNLHDFWPNLTYLESELVRLAKEQGFDLKTAHSYSDFINTFG